MVIILSSTFMDVSGLCYTTPMIKKRTKNFVDTLIANPTMSAAQAYVDTHESNNRYASRVSASQLLNSPGVLAYMEQKAPMAEKAVVQVLQNAKQHKTSPQMQRLTLDAANSILDRTHGKPLTRTISAQTNLNIETSLNSLD